MSGSYPHRRITRDRVRAQSIPGQPQIHQPDPPYRPAGGSELRLALMRKIALPKILQGVILPASGEMEYMR